MKMRREGGKGMGGIEFFPSEEKFAFQKKFSSYGLYYDIINFLNFCN